MASNPNLSAADRRPVVAPSTVVQAGDVDRPFRTIFSMAAACFIAAFVTDFVYTRAPDFVWVTFSVWGITIGLFIALLAAIVGLVDRVVHRRLGTLGRVWVPLLCIVAACVAEIFNAFVHSRDAYQSVVPEGITLSAVAVVLLLIAAFTGRSLSANRNRESL